MRLSYNAPVVLTFTLIAAVVMLLDYLFQGVTSTMFTLHAEFHFAQVGDYLRLFTHVLGHANWEHLLGNAMFLLLMGPILEEKYGSKKLLLIMAVNAVVTSILWVVLIALGIFAPASLLGASGIVFTFVLLGSFANFKAGTIPITFILVAILYIGHEVLDAMKDDQVSQFGHILGGAVGTLFGFVLGKGKAAPAPVV